MSNSKRPLKEIQALLHPLYSETAPRIDARFWSILSLASICGCNLGDCLSYYIHWNHWAGLAPSALLFGFLLYQTQVKERRSEMWYWAMVIVLRAAATNIADLATHTFDFRFSAVLIALSILQVLIAEQTTFVSVKEEVATKPAVNGWYWLSLLTAGTLGTAAGDWVAEGLNLGTGFGSLLLALAFAIALRWGRARRWSTALTYWLPVVAVRAAGTTAGDWVAFNETKSLNNGLGLGLAFSSLLTTGLFVGTLIAWRPRHTVSTKR